MARAATFLATTLAAACLVSSSNAQHYFNGIGKNTWPANDPIKCSKWFHRYFKGCIEEPNNCKDNICVCGQTGRIELLNVTGKPVHMPGLPLIDVFGVHSVNCSQHPQGPCAMYQVEHGFRSAFNATVDAQGASYNELLDYNLGLWTSSFGPLLDQLDADGVLYHPMRWESAFNNGSSSDSDSDSDADPPVIDVFSVLANPCGAIFIEFISIDAGGRDLNFFHPTLPRMDFSGEWNHPPPLSEMTHNPYGLVPLKISRGTTDLPGVMQWYTSFFDATSPLGGITVQGNDTFMDGTRRLAITLPDTKQTPWSAAMKSSVHLQFWDRSPNNTSSNNNNNNGNDAVSTQVSVDVGEAGAPTDCFTWTVDKLQSYLLAELFKEMRSDTCGFSKWLDFHYSYDCISDDCQLDDFTARMRKMGQKYRWNWATNFLKSGQNWWQIYTYDPSGFGVQLHFSVNTTPPEAPPPHSLPPVCFFPYANGTCPGAAYPGQCT